MKLTTFTDYSLRILLMLAARRDALLTIAQVAEYFEISEAHLTKVVHTLGRSGWVETVRGRNGGMRLIADAEQLRLDQIVLYLEESFELAECFQSQNGCQLTGQCGLERALVDAKRQFISALSQYSLQALAASTTFPPHAASGMPTVLRFQPPSEIRLKTT